MFFEDIEQLIEAEQLQLEELLKMEEFFYEVQKASLEPIAVIDADWIIENIPQCDFPDDSGYTQGNFAAILTKHIDFDRLNNDLPKVWRPLNEVHTITKEDLLNFF